MMKKGFVFVVLLASLVGCVSKQEVAAEAEVNEIVAHIDNKNLIESDSLVLLNVGCEEKQGYLVITASLDNRTGRALKDVALNVWQDSRVVSDHLISYVKAGEVLPVKVVYNLNNSSVESCNLSLKDYVVN